MVHVDLHALKAFSNHPLIVRLIIVNLPVITFDVLTVIMEYSPMEAVVVMVIMDSAMAVVGSTIVSAIIINIEVVNIAGGRCGRHGASRNRVSLHWVFIWQITQEGPYNTNTINTNITPTSCHTTFDSPQNMGSIVAVEQSSIWVTPFPFDVDWSSYQFYVFPSSQVFLYLLVPSSCQRLQL